MKLAVADINNDGYRDFVIGNERGGVRFYSQDTNTVFTNQRIPSETLAITLFPNPAHDYIMLDFDTALHGQATIQIINSVGQVLQNKHFTNLRGQQQIEVNDLPKGIYFCRVQSDKGSWTQAFSVQ